MYPDAAFWIDHFKLTKHIEGGYFSEVYKSATTISTSELPANFSSGQLPSCTHIYFLLEKDQFSALHRIKSDELWHFYAGDPLIIYEFDKRGKLVEHLLGNDPRNKQNPFACIKAGNWFGARLQENTGYALAGCTVSPGFDYHDFELAESDQLAGEFPDYNSLIRSLCLK